jgi:type IV secretion system protein VirB6
LLGVYLAAVLTFALVISSDYMDRMIANTGNVNAMSDAFGFVVINGVLLVVAYQLPQLAAGLTGGISVSGGGLAAFAMGKLTGRGGRGDGGGGGGGSDGGGSVSNASGSSASSAPNTPPAASSGGSGGGYKPAYRRATLDRIHGPK